MAAPRKYSEEQRRMAVIAYIVNGETFTGASEQTGIPWETIRGSRDASPEWWERVSGEAWSRYDEQIKAKYGTVITEGVQQLIDRVQLGDKALNKDGIEIRVPLKALDLAKIVGICQDKLNITRGKPTSISAKAVDTASDKLAELRQAAQLKAVA